MMQSMSKFGVVPVWLLFVCLSLSDNGGVTAERQETIDPACLHL